MQTKTYHLICYFLFALALVLIGTIGSAGILVAACAAEDTMGSAVNRLCELHLIVPLVLGIDRALADDEAFAELERRYPELVDRIYRFRDFPGVDRTLRVLERFAGERKG